MSAAVDVLVDSGVDEEKIIILTLFATYHGMSSNVFLSKGYLFITCFDPSVQAWPYALFYKKKVISAEAWSSY